MTEPLKMFKYKKTWNKLVPVSDWKRRLKANLNSLPDKYKFFFKRITFGEEVWRDKEVKDK